MQNHYNRAKTIEKQTPRKNKPQQNTYTPKQAHKSNNKPKQTTQAKTSQNKPK